MGPVHLPGMVVGGAAATARVTRPGANVWWLALGGSVDDDGPRDETASPSAAIGRARVLAKIELDACGAWATLANAGPARPVVVRRAGWVDLRGHPSGTVADDRVGLGPGDAVVLWDGDGAAEETAFSAALARAGDEPAVIAAAVGACDGVDDVVAVGVPSDLGVDPAQRVADATGLAGDDVELPGYPLGDLQPDLWQQPPTPPRVARLALRPELRSIGDVRTLLDRLLASWRLQAVVDADDVKLVATELATNAIVHAGVPETVTVRYLGDRVVVEVTDTSPRRVAPAARAAADDAVSGRGLFIVDALTDDWGVDADERGKRVWCEIRVGPVVTC